MNSIRREQHTPNVVDRIQQQVGYHAEILCYFLLVVAFCLALTYHVEIDLNGDDIRKWEMALQASVGNFSYMNFSGVIDPHHYMRWGSWLPATLAIKLFGNSPSTYVVWNATNYFIALLLLTSLVFRYLATVKVANKWAIPFIYLVMLTDPNLNWAASQFMPSNHSILPLSIAFITTVRLIQRQTYLRIFSTAIALFWLYGVKETNALIFPIFFITIALATNLKTTIKLALITAPLPILENLLLFLANPELGLLPRFNYHLNVLPERFTIGPNPPSYQRTIDKYFDSGIYFRWHKLKDTVGWIYFLSLLASIFVFSRLDGRKKTVTHHSVGFLFFGSFLMHGMLISIPISGNPLWFTDRYLLTILPVAYFCLILATPHLENPVRWTPVTSVTAVFLFYLMLAPNAQGLAWQNRKSTFGYGDCLDEYTHAVNRNFCFTEQTSRRFPWKHIFYQNFFMEYEKRPPNFDAVMSKRPTSTKNGKLHEVTFPPSCDSPLPFQSCFN